MTHVTNAARGRKSSSMKIPDSLLIIRFFPSILEFICEDAFKISFATTEP